MVLTQLLKQIFSGMRKQSASNRVEKARDLLTAGDLANAELVLGSVKAGVPHYAEALYLMGAIEYRRNNHTNALIYFRKAETHGFANAEQAYVMARCHNALGDTRSALQSCEKALSHDEDYGNALVLSSLLSLPGPDYLEVLTSIHRIMRPATYFEVGVFQGRSLELAHRETQAIGIDPSPQLLKPAGQNARIHTLTSDDYFGRHDVTAELGGRPVELAFIDGMHHFEFALRDFMNIERHCTHNSIVLVHDCYPLNQLTARRERATSFWSGDVWKVILALKKYRPDLEIHTIATAPTGLGLIRNLDPMSQILSSQLDSIIAEFMALDYSVLDHDKAEKLNSFPNDFSRIQALLQPRPVSVV